MAAVDVAMAATSYSLSGGIQFSKPCSTLFSAVGQTLWDLLVVLETSQKYPL
ncbi:hypothetical protein [Planctopirus hydrillae]|uniref:hypothetical protein n=1 Tax=Planctopirus hydrillae TaxID=1841610 RepID=UPI0013F4D809|nr:hypothetical protein [Planctopirus hydrillae]